MNSSPTHTRKRSSAWLEEDSHPNVSLAYTPLNPTSLPSKRLQNSSGTGIATTKPSVKYDAQRLLGNLAFTRFYVTENFANFSPTTSHVLLCMVGEQNGLYRGLCHILPALYRVSASLQAFAITTGYVSPNAMADQALQRVLPLVTTAGVEATVVEEFEQFRRDLGGEGDCVAVVGPDGTCLYSSTAENFDAETGSDGGVVRLQVQIVGALGLASPEDVTMGDA